MGADALRGGERSGEMRIWSVSLQKEVYPKDLPLEDLIHNLKSIEIDEGSCWMPETETKEGYASINEAIRRLKRGAISEQK